MGPGAMAPVQQNEGWSGAPHALDHLSAIDRALDALGDRFELLDSSSRVLR